MYDRNGEGLEDDVRGEDHELPNACGIEVWPGDGKLLARAVMLSLVTTPDSQVSLERRRNLGEDQLSCGGRSFFFLTESA